MQSAYKQGRYKLDKAAKILYSINDIVLEELEITLAEIEERKTFSLSHSSLEERFDVFYYQPYHSEILERMKRRKYKIDTLGQIARSIVSGQRPKGGVRHVKKGMPSLGGEHITLDGYFTFEDIRFIPEEFFEKQKRSWIKPFDILVVKDGATTGKVAIVPEDFPYKKCSINEHLFKITLKENFDPYYVFSFLSSDLGQRLIERQISGGFQKGITRKSIGEIKVVVPPIKIQEKIAESISKIREEVKELRRGTDKAFSKAKGKVERMILRGSLN